MIIEQQLPVAKINRLMGLFTRYLLLFGMITIPLFSQSFNASLTGLVQDPAGAAVAGAEVTVTNSATNAKLQAATNARGEYLVTPLPPGRYVLEVVSTGFKKYTQQGIVLEVQQQARVDVALAVGDVSEAVTVNADASLLETTTSALGKVVDNRAILSLPLNTRNVYSLIYLTPGVAGSIGNSYNSMSYSVNGARTSLMETLVDGMTGGHPTVQGYSGIAVFPSVDAIAEFKVQGANYSAEFGRSLGSVLNVVYKSGTNTFHGSAYEFLRNSVLDANNFFANSRGQALASFKRSQFGGVLNGPIVRNKTFFLLSYEGLRERSFGDTTQTVPTALQRTGDFSQTFAPNGQLIRIYDPLSPGGANGKLRSQFPGNVIPTSRLNSVALNVLKYYPQPNTTGNAVTNANNFYAQGTRSLDIDPWDVRVDHQFSDARKFFARYSNRVYTDTPPRFYSAEQTVAEGRIIQENYMRNFVTEYSDILSPTTIFTGRLGFSRSLYYYRNQGVGFQASSLGLPSVVDTAGGLPMFPTFSPDGFTQLGNTDDRRNAFMTYAATASLSKIHGSHSMKFGWDGRLIRANNREARQTSGSYSFGRNFTQGPDPNTAGATLGNGLATMLLGYGSGSLIQDFKNVAAQSFYHAFYFQDDWRVTRKLTLNLGVRYEFDTPRTERYNRMNWFDTNATSPLAAQQSQFPNLRGGLRFVGVDGNPRTQFPTDWNNLAPRIGFAYQLDDKTVLRGGYGNFYGISFQQATGTVGPYGFRVETPWVGSIDGITPYDTLSNPFPRGIPKPNGTAAGLLTQAGANIEAFYQDLVTPYSMQWTFNVQRELPAAIHLEVGYVGTRGLQLMRNDESGLNVNQLDPKYLALGSALNDKVPNPFYGLINTGVFVSPTISRAQLLRPYPQFTNIVPLYSSGSSSTYHAMQSSFRKRLSGGLQFDGSYTWAKALDNGMSHQNSYDIRSSRSLASFDVSHRFVLGFVYELPLGRNRLLLANANRLTDILIGGWQVNGIATYQTGTPLGISASNVAGLFNPRETANNNGKSARLDTDIHTRLNRAFDTSVFSQPAAFTFGNTSPYISDLRSDSTRNWDVSLFKQFALVERLSMQFRAEFLNAFNTVRFGSPNTSVTSTSFGQITSQGNTPRQIQFAVKFLF